MSETRKLGDGVLAYLREHIVWVLIVSAIVLGLLSALLGSGDAGESLPGWSVGWLQNMSTEMIGGVIAYLVFTEIIGGRRQKEAEARATEERKAQLIRQMGSTVNAVAIRAVEELFNEGWLRDGSLRKARLVEANLQEAKLSAADLQDADLVAANLRAAALHFAKLQRAQLGQAKLLAAILTEASLQDADLSGADVSLANLERANLQKAVLNGANLRGTNFAGANLRGASTKEAGFDAGTILPDGSHWTRDTKMSDFTTTTHDHH